MLNWALRYSTAVDLIDEVSPRSVLDVGSGDHGLNRYRTYDFVVRTDLLEPASLVDPGPFLVADALRLPVKDAAFDVVLSLDLLEHLEAPDRPQAIAEMCRVARTHVVIGFPVGAIARRTDAAHSRVLRLIGRHTPDWLQEHRSHEYPDSRTVPDSVPAGWSVEKSLGNCNAFVQGVSVLLDSTRQTIPMAGRLAERAVREGLPSAAHARPAYRQIFRLRRD